MLGVALAGAGSAAYWSILGIVTGVLLLGAMSTTHWAEATARRAAAATTPA